MSISTYLHIAKSLANELALAGRAVSQAEFNAIIYRNIGAKFHPIILTLNMCTELISFQEIHSQLRKSYGSENLTSKCPKISSRKCCIFPFTKTFPIVLTIQLCTSIFSTSTILLPPHLSSPIISGLNLWVS